MATPSDPADRLTWPPLTSTLALALGLLAGGLTGCRCTEQSPPTRGVAPPAARPQAGRAQASPRAWILLSMAQFSTNERGRVVPGPARLVVLKRQRDGKWKPYITIEDSDSTVFHKAHCLAGPGDPMPRILTISGAEAYLKIWSCGARKHCTATSLWRGEFGGRRDRLRDFELADLDGDGHLDLALATHDQGVVALLKGGPRGLTSGTPRELHRKADTFIHEVEVGDLDGDGRPEIYATPSRPNRADVSQPGAVLALVRDEGGEYRPLTVASFAGRHVKEILVADLDGQARPELYASLEARLEKPPGGGAARVIEPLQIWRYLPDGPGKYRGEAIATLRGGVQARFLLPADLDGDGRQELVVTTMKAGVSSLTPPRAGGSWGIEKIDEDSGGYEHAAAAADLDGDGRQELYVVSDRHRELRRYRRDGQEFDRQVLHRISKQEMVWNITACQGTSTP